MTDLLEFVDDYYERFVGALRSLDKAPLEDIFDVLMRLRDEGGTLWVAGNGGSAAISAHTVCDTTKGTHVEGMPPVRSVSLPSNVAMLTALGNDICYDDVFRQQLVYCLQPNDVLLLISSSGNSANVVRACEYARERGVTTIAFVGFSGGKLKDLADYAIHVEEENYGIVEDTHQSLIHVVTQYMKKKAVDGLRSSDLRAVSGDSGSERDMSDDHC